MAFGNHFLKNWQCRQILCILCFCSLVGQFGGEYTSSESFHSGCPMVYKDGALPTISQQQKCSRNLQRNYWVGCRRVLKGDWKKLRGNCEVALHQGRRNYQEDRAFCALDVKIRWPGWEKMQEMKVGLLAVFDGHNGAEASELAAELLPEYFFLHTFFLLEGFCSVDSFVGFKKTTEGLPEAGQLAREVQKSKTLTKNGHCFEDVAITEDDVTRAQQYGPHCLEVCSKEEEDQLSVEVSLKDGCMRKFELKRSQWTSLESSEDSIYRKILKEALIRAIYDIDIAFSKEAFHSDLQSGSTASIVLKADGHVLVANIGDSKSLLCAACSSLPSVSWREHKRRQRKAGRLLREKNANIGNIEGDNCQSLLCVKELTQDHHPDREEEKVRIEAAGGSVLMWGDVPRVNGELAISRAIGDVSFKQYGVIAEPEITDWQHLSSNDSYLVVASDGIFEKMNTQDICNLLLESKRKTNHSTEILPANMHSLAQAIVSTAFNRGSMDNLAAVVLPLDSSTHSPVPYFHKGSDPEQNYDSGIDREENVGGLDSGLFSSDQEISVMFPGPSEDVTNSYQMSKKSMHQILADLHGMLIQGRQNTFYCYHLIENLVDDKDYVFQSRKKDVIIKENDGFQALPKGIVPLHRDWQLDLYHDQELCLSFELASKDGNKKCLNLEGFANFFGLIRSIPFDSRQFNSTESSIYDRADFSYFLERRFDRGSFGEVWLAVHKNCSHSEDGFNLSSHESQGWERRSASINNTNNGHDNYKCNSTEHSPNCCTSDKYPRLRNNETFILKRIMVERGNIVYLSGLREKHFGEIFLNASVSLGGSQWKAVSKTFSGFKSRLNFVTEGSVSESNVSGKEGSAPFFGELQKPFLTTEGNEDEEGLKHIARYVESFETQSKELWLIFRNEGQSLSKLMYTGEAIQQHAEKEKAWSRENVQVLHPSSWWHWLRQTEAGKEEMRSLIQQLLLAAKACHDRNITHRDIKPENMVVCATDGRSSDCLTSLSSRNWPSNLTMRIIDFGSAIDEFTLEHLYGVNGPSRAEQTIEYAPPEAILQNKWFHGSHHKTLKYDMWSIGVVMLELILGTPHVFQISARTNALLDQHLEGWNEVTKDLAYRLRALMEMCILLPGSSPHHHRHQKTGRIQNQLEEVWPASWECSEEAFAQQIKQRDPLKLGFPNIWALRLVRQLLQWHPEDRITAAEALQHPYFNPNLKTEYVNGGVPK